MSKIIFADRGQSTELRYTIGETERNPTWAVVSRLGRLRIASPARSVWLQMRGSCRIESSEGSFLLQRGEWIAFASDSLPQLQSEHGGLTMGLVLPAAAEETGLAHHDHFPLVGRGRVPRCELRLAMRTWRHAALQAPSETMAATRPFLLNLSHFQQELIRELGRCPGRSFRRKREMFEAMQRTKLYLDGNSHRIVRMTELAAMTGFSSWYLSKIFMRVYKASPQSVGCRYRLERARHLLANTALAITDVSTACGFSCLATFSRAFRSGHGMTASNYRNYACRTKWNNGVPAAFDNRAAAHP